MKITVTEEAKNDNDFKFLEMRMTMLILLYLAKEGKGPFCSEVSFPVGSPPMSDCKCGVSWIRIILRTMMMVVNTMIMMIMTNKYEISYANPHSLGSSYQAQKDWRLQRWGPARYSPATDHVIVTLSIFKFTVMSLP